MLPVQNIFPLCISGLRPGNNNTSQGLRGDKKVFIAVSVCSDERKLFKLRCLPLLFSLNDDISSLKANLTHALDKLTIIEAQAGVTCTKTREVLKVFSIK